MIKLKQFYKSIANANGSAQVLGYSFWGVLMAGMLWDFDPKELHHPLLAGWAALSVLVLVSSIWCSKKITQELLLLDMVVSAIVLAIVAMHDEEVMRIMYTVQSDGHFIKSYVSQWFTVAGLAWMSVHGAYLANLLQRQRMEMERFKDEH